MLFDYFGDLNWLAVLVAALAYFALGAIWYSNALFGKAYRAALGITEQGRPSPMLLVINFVGWFISATAMGLIGAAIGASTVLDGIVLGFVAGVGFVVVSQVVGLSFEGRKGLMGIYVPYTVPGFVIMGVILAAWQ
ncbi:MAG: DUF1761 domain-containing protein [Acidimicrobiia bacterium]